MNEAVVSPVLTGTPSKAETVVIPPTPNVSDKSAAQLNVTIESTINDTIGYDEVDQTEPENLGSDENIVVNQIVSNTSDNQNQPEGHVEEKEEEEDDDDIQLINDEEADERKTSSQNETNQQPEVVLVNEKIEDTNNEENEDSDSTSSDLQPGEKGDDVIGDKKEATSPESDIILKSPPLYNLIDEPPAQEVQFQSNEEEKVEEVQIEKETINKPDTDLGYPDLFVPYKDDKKPPEIELEQESSPSEVKKPSRGLFEFDDDDDDDNDLFSKPVPQIKSVKELV